jgi:hypothetical protein
MVNHVNKHIIEKYFLNPGILTQDEKNSLLGHIGVCSLCAEEFESIGNFYNLLEREIQFKPNSKDKDLVERLVIRKRFFLQGRRRELEGKNDLIVEAFTEIVGPYKRSLPQRALAFIRYRPMRSAGMAIGMLAVLLGALFILRPVKDSTVAYARAKDEFLVAYNKSGGEVWRKHIGVGYDWNELKTSYRDMYDSPEEIANAIDIDGDGNREVVSLYAVEGSQRESNSIVCFNSDGSQRWRYEFHRNMVFGKESFTDDYVIRTFKIVDFRHNKKLEIVALADHRTYYPSAIVLIDAGTGALISEFWHSGLYMRLLTRDMERDGYERIIAIAQNNGFNVSSVTVLDPRTMSGHAPAPPDYTPQGIPEGTEEFYMTIPRSDLKNLAAQKRNVINKSFLNSEGLELVVSEVVNDVEYPLYFHFDSMFKCARVENSDVFVVFHQRMEAEGKLTQKLTEQYYENLRQDVQYWDGEKFVRKPVQNKNYKMGMTS